MICIMRYKLLVTMDMDYLATLAYIVLVCQCLQLVVAFDQWYSGTPKADKIISTLTKFSKVLSRYS